MKLKDVLNDISTEFIKGEINIEISELRYDSREVEENNLYRYEGNAMALSIGLRKQLTDSFSAGLLYSWEKWMNETEDFSVKKDVQNSDKAFEDDSQEALNLILRYDF